MRVVGLNRVRLDEYPVEALREALVNAVAHRDYEDASRKIMLEVFSDRVVVSSPGLPPSPLTLQKLRTGKYKPCSRNPILAQSLSFFHRIEERGSGFRRMHDQMLDHGLGQPRLGTETGYFQVIFPGPGDDLERLRVPASAVTQIVPPSVEAQLNQRQRKIVTQILKQGFVTSGWCKKQLAVAYDTVRRDLLHLIELGMIEPTGKGRSTKYVLKARSK
jgi:predicted HTH transcriptional regulator